MEYIQDPGRDLPFSSHRPGRHRPIDEWETDDPIGALMDLMRGPEWMADAACRGMQNSENGTPTDMFFPGRGEHVAMREAKAVCTGCPVREECLEWAVSYENEQGQLGGAMPGVWGGTSERERRRIRKAKRVAA